MPPRMFRDFPNPTSDEIPDKAERAVYKALRGSLPDDWAVFYHYVYTVKEGYRRPEDGEADFIILVPRLGVLFLEVKGSRSFESIDGIWYVIDENNNRTKTKNPFEQAIKNKHNIIKNIICRSLGISKDKFPASYCHAIIYPFGDVSGKLPPAQCPQVFINLHSMDKLKLRIERVFSDFGYRPDDKNLSSGLYEKIVDILKGNTKFVPVISKKIDSHDLEDSVIEEENVIEELTREQYEVFRNILMRNRVKVNGRAGSGKTMFAAWAADALSSIGNKVLIICYNSSLANWIDLKYKLPSSVKVTYFHMLVREYARKANILNRYQIDDRFWQEDSAVCLLEAIDILGNDCKFDSVIVDEGQDFSPLWWLPVESLLKENATRHFYIFYDPDQSIFINQRNGVTADYPMDMADYFLTKNCRNTRKIIGYCGNFTQNPIETFEKSPEGMLPQIVNFIASPNDRAARAKKIINDWINEGFEPSQIALISPWNSDNNFSVLCHLNDVNKYPVRGESDDVGNWINNEIIWGSTIKKFKGLEASCVLIADIPVVGALGFDREDMYVAASRAKQRLVLLPASNKSFDEVQKWLKTQS